MTSPPRPRWVVALAMGLVVVSLGAGAWWLKHARSASVPTEDDVMRSVMARVDDDHDGRVSRQEWRRYGGADNLFDQYDTSHDGYLDLGEFRSMFSVTDPLRLDSR